MNFGEAKIRMGNEVYTLDDIKDGFEQLVRKAREVFSYLRETLMDIFDNLKESIEKHSRIERLRLNFQIPMNITRKPQVMSHITNHHYARNNI